MGKIAEATRTWVLGQEQKRQLLAFDVELEKADEKVRRLEAQVLDLEKKVNPIQREVEGLKKKLQEQSAEAERAAKLAAFKRGKSADADEKVDHLDEIEILILRMLALVDLDEITPPYLQEVADALKLNAVRTEVILGRLRDKEFIRWDGRESTWRFLLSTKGKQYLVDNNIL